MARPHLTRNQLRVLRFARKYASMETFTTGPLRPEERLYRKAADGTFVEVDVAAELKERTRIYRQSWVLPYLDAVINDENLIALAEGAA